MNEKIIAEAHLPTLSRAGYVSGSRIIAKKLFDYYILSLYSQTNTYYGNIASLAYTLYVGGDDMDAVIDYIKDTLTKMYLGYFKEVTIEVTETTGEIQTRATIQLGMYLSDGVEKFTLDSAINVTEGVIDLSNYGNQYANFNQ